MAAADPPAPAQHLTIGPQGRIVIPAPLREALGWGPGTKVVARLEDGRVVLETPDQVRDRVHALFTHVRGSMARELGRDRAREARREARDLPGPRRRSRGR
jgi:AbrB family looped-hinge helix DNA binding protein